MSVVLKSQKELNGVTRPIKTRGPHEKEGWLQRFLNWLTRGSQKELNRQGACFG